MKPRDVEKRIAEMSFEASSKMHDRVLDDIFLAHCHRKKGRLVHLELNIWRIIMRSKITKIATVAVIIITVMIGINQFGGSFDIASTAFAQMAEAIKNMPCVHVVIEGRRGGEEHHREHWFDFESEIMCEKYSDGRVSFINIERSERYVYNPSALSHIM